MTTMQQVDYFNGHKAYVHYMALKRHFTSKSYDFFKYGGKVNSPYDTFKTRHDAPMFQVLSKKKDYQNLILANILHNPKVWVGGLLDQESEEVYFEWKKRNDSLSYFFKMDLKNLKDDFQDNFSFKGGTAPHVVSLTMAKDISMETFTILSHMTKSFNYWEENGFDNIVYSGILTTSKKYHPFLQYDRKKFKEMIKDRFFLV